MHENLEQKEWYLLLVGLLDGILFKEVTQNDLAEIGNIEGMNIGICIRYQLLGLTDEEFDLETIAIVDDCCCD